MDHRMSMDPGSPSVLFRRQLCHILLHLVTVSKGTLGCDLLWNYLTDISLKAWKNADEVHLLEHTSS